MQFTSSLSVFSGGLGWSPDGDREWAGDLHPAAGLLPLAGHRDDGPGTAQAGFHSLKFPLPAEWMNSHPRIHSSLAVAARWRSSPPPGSPNPGSSPGPASIRRDSQGTWQET
jgi:hypothetical protein